MGTRHSDSDYGKPLYRESLRWPLLLWAFILFIDFSIWVSVWAALPGLAPWITLVILFLATLSFFHKSKLRITVTQGWLIVGPAAIERAYIFDFKPLSNDQMRRARGVEVKPTDYLQIRFWSTTGIKCSLRDPKDQTSSWIISTNNPEKLVETLAKPSH